MSEKLTAEQAAVISAQGKLIVSASAGSGKTFVMIKKLGDFIQNGGDIDNVLAVTFTKKAAAQMKEKLRAALIERLAGADGESKKHLKAQLNKISSANVSTIHSFCAYLLRTYFYFFDFEGSFDVIFDSDPVAATLKARALEELFTRLYEEDDNDLLLLLDCFRKKRSDKRLKELILCGYNSVKNTVDYHQKLSETKYLYCEQGFDEVCAQLRAYAVQKINSMRAMTDEFLQGFFPNNKNAYLKLFDEIYSALNAAEAQRNIFAPLPPLTVSRKPADKQEDKPWGELYKEFRTKLKAKYDGLYPDITTREEEQKNFLQSGKIAVAFANIVAKFDEEYDKLKKEEGKLDCADLEHYTLRLLKNGQILSEIQSRFTHIFIDEYQDVNPVQEKILSTIVGKNVLQVGDVKQAIYGFRGSKSKFFAEKFAKYKDGEGLALKLSNNFRSSDKVVEFVNKLFSLAMREDVCGIDYKKTSLMLKGGFYPENSGYAKVHVFGKEAKQKVVGSGIYSVLSHKNAQIAPSREGLAVVKIVKDVLGKEYYDLKEKKYKTITTGDICLLSRKGESDNVLSIARALSEAGYPVSGSQDSNLCNRPEIKKLIDILSYIENSEQDIPLVSTLLSPIGGFTEDELAKIKLYGKTFEKDLPIKQRTYRRCCRIYADVPNYLGKKLQAFFAKIEEYKTFAELFGAASLIDRIMEDTLWEAQYSKGGGALLKNVRRFTAEARGANGELSLCAFMQKLKAGGFDLPAPEDASSDGIKIMTMHSSKGLEFPIVILCDLRKTFKGKGDGEILFDDELGFVCKSYFKESMLSTETLLWRLAKIKAKRENLKNEANLYYVACTRAMYGIHLLVEELKPFSLHDVIDANCYADMADLSLFDPEYMQFNEDDTEKINQTQTLISSPDKLLLSAIEDRFEVEYGFKESVDLPVKTSASQILKKMQEDDYWIPKTLFPQEESEGDTSKDTGVAYHRFLELCDFEKRSEQEIEAQLNGFINDGFISPEQAQLLSQKKLYKILSMPVFSKLSGARIWREREFLCRLPANELLNTSAQDGILVQGAIDLLAQTSNGFAIIDYKYSKKSAATLKETYAPQLALYKKAVSLILKVDENTVSTTIVNIFSGEEISL